MIQVVCDCCERTIGERDITRRAMNISAPQNKDFKPMSFDLCEMCVKTIVVFIQSRKEKPDSIESGLLVIR